MFWQRLISCVPHQLTPGWLTSLSAHISGQSFKEDPTRNTQTLKNTKKSVCHIFWVFLGVYGCCTRWKNESCNTVSAENKDTSYVTTIHHLARWKKIFRFSPLSWHSLPHTDKLTYTSHLFFFPLFSLSFIILFYHTPLIAADKQNKI